MNYKFAYAGIMGMIKQCVSYNKGKDMNKYREIRPGKQEAYSNLRQKAQPRRPS